MEKITKKMKRILFCLPFFLPFIIIYLWLLYRKLEISYSLSLENVGEFIESLIELIKDDVINILDDVLYYRVDYILSILFYLIIFL